MYLCSSYLGFSLAVAVLRNRKSLISSTATASTTSSTTTRRTQRTILHRPLIDNLSSVKFTRDTRDCILNGILSPWIDLFFDFPNSLLFSLLSKVRLLSNFFVSLLTKISRVRYGSSIGCIYRSDPEVSSSFTIRVIAYVACHKKFLRIACVRLHMQKIRNMELCLSSVREY